MMHVKGTFTVIADLLYIRTAALNKTWPTKKQSGTILTAKNNHQKHFSWNPKCGWCGYESVSWVCLSNVYKACNEKSS